MSYKKSMSKRPFVTRAAEPHGPGYTVGPRTLQVAEDIMPIAELKAKLGDVVRGLEDRRPLVITLNGKAAAVLMSPREFDRLTSQRRVLDAIAEGLADVEAGRTYDADAAFDEVEAELDRSSRPAARRKR